LLSIRGNASTVAVDPTSQIAPVEPAEIPAIVERDQHRQPLAWAADRGPAAGCGWRPEPIAANS
jgi:hypothetical protein